MRETVKDKGRIEHMLEMALNLRQAGLVHAYEEILSDKILFYGLTKMAEIIGEAAYKLTHEFKESHPELPWREIIGMRHLLVHGYFTISPVVLWNVIQSDIPPMIPVLETYVRELSE